MLKPRTEGGGRGSLLRARVPASAQSCAAQRLRNGAYVRFDLDGLSDPAEPKARSVI